MTTYKAQIEFIAHADDYEKGEGELITSWHQGLKADTPGRLKELILEITHTESWDDVNDDQMNEYDWCTEYATSYQAINDNYFGLTPPSDYEVDQWKIGKELLYSVNCHILVTQVTEEKAVL